MFVLSGLAQQGVSKHERALYTGAEVPEASWVGLILLATATSLPELVTGLSAVTAAGASDIAVGDVLGSAVFNLLILVLLEALYRRESIYGRAAQGHILSAALGGMLVLFAAFSLLLEREGISVVLAHVGIYTPLIRLIWRLPIYSVAICSTWSFLPLMTSLSYTVRYWLR